MVTADYKPQLRVACWLLMQSGVEKLVVKPTTLDLSFHSGAYDLSDRWDPLESYTCNSVIHHFSESIPTY